MTRMSWRFGAPYWQIYRPDYHKVLLEAATKAGVEVRKGCKVDKFLPAEASVQLESGETVQGDLVIAADGVKSLARQTLEKYVEPHETGDTCFRVVISGESLLANPRLAQLVQSPAFEQFLGPDHHIVG